MRDVTKVGFNTSYGWTAVWETLKLTKAQAVAMATALNDTGTKFKVTTSRTAYCKALMGEQVEAVSAAGFETLLAALGVTQEMVNESEDLRKANKGSEPSKGNGSKALFVRTWEVSRDGVPSHTFKEVIYDSSFRDVNKLAYAIAALKSVGEEPKRFSITSIVQISGAKKEVLFQRESPSNSLMAWVAEGEKMLKA